MKVLGDNRSGSLAWIHCCCCCIALCNIHSASGQEHSTQRATRLIVDCDPAGLTIFGLDVDDDLALMNLLSLHRQSQQPREGHNRESEQHFQQPKVSILGVTVIGGNAPLRYTYSNAVELIQNRLGHADLGIYPGAPKFWSRDLNLNDLSKANRSDLLGTFRTPATDFLIDTIHRESSKSVTILCLGPLTNLASAYILDPSIADKIEKVVFIGGTMTSNLPNDLNVRSDPVAAAMVLNHMPVPKWILPVETCVQATLGPVQYRRIRDHCLRSQSSFVISYPICHPRYQWRMWLQMKVMPWFVNWRFISKDETNKQLYSSTIDDGFIVWDLVALWAMFRPDLFDDWTMYEVHARPTFPSLWGRGGRNGRRLEMEFENPFAVNMSDLTTFSKVKNFERSANHVLIPLTLRKEEELHEAVLQHLLSWERYKIQRKSSNMWNDASLDRDWKNLLTVVLALGLSILFLGTKCF